MLPENVKSWLKSIKEASKTETNKDVIAIAFQALNNGQIIAALSQQFQQVGLPSEFAEQAFQTEKTGYPKPTKEVIDWYANANTGLEGTLIVKELMLGD